MADILDDIYKEFVDAMAVYSEAMEAMTNNMNQLRSAERRLEKALDEFAGYMGEQFNKDTMKEYGSASWGRSFLRGNTGSVDISDFFDLGGLF